MRGALSQSPLAALTTHRWRLNPQTARLRLEADPRGGATGRAPPQACPGALALCPHSAPSVGVCPDLAKTPVRGDHPPQRPVHLHALSEGLALKTAASEDQGSGCHHTDLGGGEHSSARNDPPQGLRTATGRFSASTCPAGCWPRSPAAGRAWAAWSSRSTAHPAGRAVPGSLSCRKVLPTTQPRPGAAGPGAAGPELGVGTSSLAPGAKTQSPPNRARPTPAGQRAPLLCLSFLPHPCCNYCEIIREISFGSKNVFRLEH